MATYLISPMIHQQIAEAMVRESHPGYDRQHMGQSYAVAVGQNDTLNAVYFKEATAQWNPWPDNAEAVPVAALYEGTGYDFSDVEDGFEDDAIATARFALPELYEEFNAETYALLMEEAAEVEAAIEAAIEAEEAQIRQYQYESDVEQDDAEASYPDYRERHADAVRDAFGRYARCSQFEAEEFIYKGYAVFVSSTEGFFVDYAAFRGGSPADLPADAVRIRSIY